MKTFFLGIKGKEGGPCGFVHNRLLIAMLKKLHDDIIFFFTGCANFVIYFFTITALNKSHLNLNFIEIPTTYHNFPFIYFTDIKNGKSTAIYM